MEIYFLYIILLILCAVYSCYSRQTKYINLFLYVVIFFFTAFRDTIGVDTIAYQEIFKGFLQDISVDHLEIGFRIINKIVASINAPYWFLQIIVFGISYSFIISFLRENLSPKLIGLSLVALVCSVFYLSYLCSGVRQGIAISICLFFSKYIKLKNFKLFIGGIILAMLFHTSAIIFLLAYFVPATKIKIRYVIASFICSYLLAPYVKNIFDSVIGFATGHYMGYATMFNGDANSNSGLGIIVRLIIWSLVAILAYYKIKKEDKNYLIYYNLYVIGVCLYLMNRYVDILNRFNDYFLSFFIIIFPLSIGIFERKSAKIYIILSCILLMGLFISFILFEHNSFIPYRSYLLII